MNNDITAVALLVLAAAFAAAALFNRGRMALIMLAAGLFTVLVALAVEVNADWLTSLDDSMERWLDAHRSRRWQVDADGAFSYLGRPFHVASVGVVAGALLSLQARSAIRGLLVIGGVGAGLVLEQTFKAIVRRTPETLAALHDGRHYLVEDYALAIFTPAAPAHLPVHSQGGLATRPQDAPVHHLRVAGLGLSELNDQVRQQGFAALPAVVAELDGLVREKGRRDPAGVLPGVKYLNREFTPTRLSEVLRESFAVVHLATPCRFEPGGDTDSFLLLGDGGQERLTLGAFRSVDYPLTGVDLLTLSACQTTMGQTTMGEKHASGRELEGFGAMTRNQGAQTVLTSLWPVADASRALFMERFYQLRQDRHLSKAEALRQAQLTLLGTPDTAASPPAPAAGQELEARLEGTPDIPDFPQDQARPHAHP